MISIMYRLLHLHLPDHAVVAEVMRLGMLIFATTVFLPIQTFAGRYGYLVAHLRAAIGPYPHGPHPTLLDDHKHQHSPLDPPSLSVLHVPANIKFWLAITAALLDPSATTKPDSVFVEMLADTMDMTRSQTWDDVRPMLKEVLWISFLHDKPGRQTWESFVSKCKRDRGNTSCVPAG